LDKDVAGDKKDRAQQHVCNLYDVVL